MGNFKDLTEIISNVFYVLFCVAFVGFLFWQARTLKKRLGDDLG